MGEPSPVAGGRRERRLAQESTSTPSRHDSGRSSTRRSLSPGRAYIRSVLTSLALLALGFVALVTIGSQLQNGRDQTVLYNSFREDLANAVAPVGPTDTDGTTLTPGAPVAVIDFPSLGTKFVVVEGTSSAQTMLGPGHRRDTVLPGQQGVSVVFGRQAAFGGPFGGLGSFEPGMTIVTTTAQGVATYKVEDVRRPDDPLPPPLASGGSRLTLVSAEGRRYLPSSVVRVDALLVSTSVDGTSTTKDAFPAVGRLITFSALPDAERPLGIDTSQVFALVLWLQAFLVAVIGFTWAQTRWGRWQAWTVGLPVLMFVGWMVANQLTLLLPNLL